MRAWLVTALLAAGALAFCFPDAALAQPLRTYVRDLAASHGFGLSGSEIVGEERVRTRIRRVTPRGIVRLLADYNVVVTQGADGSVSHVAILGRNEAGLPTPSGKNLSVHRHGGSYYVEATLTGPGGRSIDERLMLDTGASTIVLPRSSAAALGISEDRLHPVRVQTVNGMIEGATAVLRTVRVGNRVAENVAVTFVADEQLGGRKLLGMSFLSRFQLMIDGASGSVTLGGRPD